MAMKEIKSFSVQPGEEENTIKLWQTFGWELVGAPQEIYNKDSNFERRGDDLYSVTTTTHYIKLTFERDPARPNYEELKSLEVEYEAQKDPYYPDGEAKIIGLGWGILIVIGLILCIVPGILILIFRLATYPKRKQKWEQIYGEYRKEMDAVKAKREEIMSKAQSLV